MRILVCDDDAAFAQEMTERLNRLLPSIDRWGQVDCVSDPALLTDEQLGCYDIAFLDIDMGETSGMDLARRLRRLQQDTVLIFVTNFVEYSLEGYEVQAFRYLLKSELDEKLEKYLRQAVSVCRRERALIRIQSEREEVDIPPQAILYIEAALRRSTLHLRGFSCDTLTTRTTLNELTALLAPRGFLRVHKSFLVNMAHIQRLQSTLVCLAGDIELPVSAHRYPEVKKDYLQWKGQKRWSIG